MKGKIAFVVGAAVGYVLGTRAGRERYEQIKRGAEAVWQTEPVQRGVGVVREALDDRADDVKAFIRRASSNAFANLAKQTADDAPKAGKSSSAGKSSNAGKSKPAAKTAKTVKTAKADEPAEPDEAGGK